MSRLKILHWPHLAPDSAVVKALKLFNSHRGFLTYAMHHQRELFNLKYTL